MCYRVRQTVSEKAREEQGRTPKIIPEETVTRKGAVEAESALHKLLHSLRITGKEKRPKKELEEV